MNEDKVEVMTVGKLKELLKQVKNDNHPILCSCGDKIYKISEDAFDVCPVVDPDDDMMITLVLDPNRKEA